jgi:hypothetical protein
MSAGRTGRHHRVIRTAKAVFDREMTRGEVDQRRRNEEGRKLSRTTLVQNDGAVVDFLKPADTGADHHSGPVERLLVRRRPAGILDGLNARRHRILNEAVHPAPFARIDPFVGVETALGRRPRRHLAGDLGRYIRDIEAFDRANAGPARDQPLPHQWHAHAQWRDQAKSCHDNAPHFRTSIRPRIRRSETLDSMGRVRWSEFPIRRLGRCSRPRP